MIPKENDESVNNEVETEADEVEDVESQAKTLEEERARAESYLANWQRAQADLINYKRRSEQEKEEITRFANSSLMLSLLPILDDLERALAAIPPELAELSWVDGIKLIERKLRSNLEAQGLAEIKAVGEAFDPTLHEAVMQGEGDEGMVISELEKGYKFHDRVIRPTMVVVGSGKKREVRRDKPWLRL